MLVASSGGHWVQLNRLLPAFMGCELIFVTTEAKYSSTVGGNCFFVVPDASRWNKGKVLWLALLMLKETGECFIELPEVIFDLDYLGHYRRRIKSASLTIPCIIGPHTNLSCTLTLMENRFRKSPSTSDCMIYH